VEAIASQVFAAALFVPRVSLVASHRFDDRIHYMQDTIKKSIIEDSQVEPVQLRQHHLIRSISVLVVYHTHMVGVISGHLVT
jgi:hypothetical protein